jgi:hypothetical protein
MLAQRVLCSVRVGCCLLGAASMFFAGCLSSKYRSAAKDTPPPVALDAVAADPVLSGTVESIVIFHGPGSWKRDAYWDEYIVGVTNRGAIPVTLTAAALVGLAGRPVTPRDDPWQLEKDSKAAAKEGFWLPPGSGPQVGGGVAAMTASIGAGALLGAASGAGFVSTGTGALIGGAVLGVAAAPVVGGGTLIRNATHRHAIEQEFERRRLRLPCTIAPGERVRGSLFFVITPGPRELQLDYRASDALSHVAVDVTKAGRLHLQPSPQPRS